MLPPVLPLFPLPNAVLFPNVFLPLHIFEPRYREMVADALDGDRIIGMVLLKPGWKDDYEGRPPIYPVGCAGLITHAEALDDGRYNIVLRGLEKFSIVREEADGRSYRRAEIDPLIEQFADGERALVREQRRRLEALLGPDSEGVAACARVPSAMPDEELVNALAQYLDLEPVERQALLEREGIAARGRSLIELLEMKLFVSRNPWSGTH